MPRKGFPTARAFASFWLLAFTLSGPSPAQFPRLVKDLNTDARWAYGSNPFNFVSVGERAFFVTQSYLESGYSIWTTEGGPENTRRVAKFPHCGLSYSDSNGILGSLGELVYFVESCPDESGSEEGNLRLWRSDGSAEGTFAIDVPVPTGPRFFVDENDSEPALAGRFFFSVGGFPVDDLELWSSDGTTEGTMRVADLPAPPGSRLNSMVHSGNRLLIFIDHDSWESVTDIWSTDGSSAGTVRLASLPLGYSPFVSSGQARAFFRAKSQVWVTDGSIAGTHAVTTFAGYDSFSGCPYQPRLVDDELLFCVRDDDGYLQVWRSDGTTGGTFPLSDFDGYQSDWGGDRLEATKLAGSYYFLGRGSDGFQALWRSEGSPGAAVRVKKISPPGIYLYGTAWLEKVGDHLVFWGYHDDGWQPFTSDGTAQGTRLLAESCFACDTFVGATRVVADRVLFTSLDERGQGQLWSTLGTPETTFPLSDDLHGFVQNGRTELNGVALDENWLFPGRDETTGFEPWLAEPARPYSAHRLRDLMVDTPGLDVYDARSLDNELAFSTREDFRYGDYGVYRTDGTDAGTIEIARTHSCNCGLVCSTPPPLVLPLRAGLIFEDSEDCESPSLRSWNRASGEVRRLFGGPEGERPGYPEIWTWNETGIIGLDRVELGTEIWRTDGSEVGTSLILAANPNEWTRPFANLPSGLVLQAGDAENRRLDYLDTANGAVVELLRYTRATELDTYPAVIGNSVYFQKGDPAEIWRSDGTPEGTTRLLSLPSADHEAGSFAGFEGRVLFSISDPATGMQLWSSNGTPSDTVLLKSFPHAADGLFAFGWIGHRALFPILRWDTETWSYRSELWSTDGTGEGTRLEMNLESDAQLEYIERFIQGADRLYFETRDDLFARAIWESDGTSSGTRLAWSQAAADSSGYWDYLQATPLGPDLVFGAKSEEFGRELQVLEPSALESRLLVDLRPGPASSSPRYVQVVEGKLYFTADDGLHGRELWKLEAVEAESCAPSETVLCLLGGRYRLELDSAAGAARAVPLTDRTGGFALAGAAEPDAFFKVVDGSLVNRKHWLFGAGLEPGTFTLRMTDTAAGEIKEWTTSSNGLASFGDIDAFPYLPESLFAEETRPAGESASSGSCPPEFGGLCFEDGRYLVEVTALAWNGTTTAAQPSALDLGPHEGAFWLYDPELLELVIRLRHDPVSDRVNFAVAALTNLGYEVRVTDSLTGRVASVQGTAGTFQSLERDDLFTVP